MSSDKVGNNGADKDRILKAAKVMTSLSLDDTADPLFTQAKAYRAKAYSKTPKLIPVLGNGRLIDRLLNVDPMS